MPTSEPNARLGGRQTRCLLMAVTMVLLPLVQFGLAGEAAKGVPANRLSVPIMKTADIKPGMKGYGLTTFRGVKPERFAVEVVDVLTGAFPKHDLILIRCSHPIIEKAHIIAGMSGSPIYIDNKLIGALAYGWGFTKEPIAGVTPIDWMLEEMDEPAPAEPKLAAIEWPDPSEKMEQNFRATPPQGLTALSVPVSLSGMLGLPKRAAARIRERLGKMGLRIEQGTTGNAAQQNIGVEALVPGAPIGVALMRGDISLTGIGTVTHREKNRIIAFGHPMLFSGQELAMPLTTAFIHGVLPSQYVSFKFGSPAKSVGTLTQDRFPAIAGTLGRKCPMIPISGEIYNPSNGKTQTINVEIINHRRWSPLLFWLTSAYLVLLEGVTDSYLIVDYALDIEFEDRDPMRLEGIDMAWAGFIISEPERALSSLMDNPFERLKPKRIHLKLKATHKRIDAKIQRAWLDQLEVQPGKKVDLHIRIQPYGDTPKEITIPIHIPAHLEEGKYDIVVGGGRNRAVQPPAPPADSVMDIYTRLKMRYRATTAVVVLKLPSVGVGFKGHLYRQLPSSVFGTLVSGSSAGVSTFQDGLYFTKDTAWYLRGQTQRLKIIVKQFVEE